MALIPGPEPDGLKPNRAWTHVGTSAWAQFAEAMTSLGPFEAKPHLAIGVSGGADSLALCLLADLWVRERGGQVTALTVDHGLRDGSEGEALRVRAQLRDLGIEHHILPWTGKKPKTGIQAEARDARYRLLNGWCRENGVLHLLLAHHQGDQAETCLMRARRGGRAGPGRAGMSALIETPWVRLLRPLLQCPKDSLETFLTEAGQAWIEDPSNRDPQFERVRIRALLRLAPGLDTRVIEDAARLAQRRVALEDAVAGMHAARVRVSPLGYAVFDAEGGEMPEDEVLCEGLSRLVMAMGGLAHAPAYVRALRATGLIRQQGNRAQFTLGGCRFTPVKSGLLVCREARNLPVPSTPKRGADVLWDGRFQLRLNKQAKPSLILAPLGKSGWSQLSAMAPGIGAYLPAPARASMPALFQERRLIAVPALDWVNPEAVAFKGKPWVSRFRPMNTLSGTGFFVA